MLPYARLLATLVLTSVLPAAERWRVFAGDTEMTTEAAPRTLGREVLINVTRCAPHLGIQVRVEARHLVLIDPAGQQWRGQDGAMTLESGGRVISLPSRLQVDAAAVYLPVESVAAVLGSTALVDLRQRTVRFAAAAQAGAPGTAVSLNEPVPEGWNGFVLPKSGSQKAASQVLAPSEIQRAKAPSTSPPKDAEVMRVDVSQGYLLGRDWGTEASASGLFYGLALSGNTLVTQGPEGIMPLSGRISLASPDRTWSLSGGDLFSEIWGLARGVRYSRQIGRNHSPVVSLYTPSRRNGRENTVLSLMDEYTIAGKWMIGGEASTDSSYFLKSSVQISDLLLHGFYRDANSTDGKSHGASLSYSFLNRVAIQARTARNGAGDNRTDVRNASVRFNTWRNTDLTLDYIDLVSPASRQRIAAGVFGTPAGPLRLRFRYQARDQVVNQLNAIAPRTSRGLFHEGFVTATYYKNRRLSADFQMANRWQRDGRVETWNQLTTTWRIDRRTDLQLVCAVPDVIRPEQMRVRFSRSIREDLVFSVDYGNVPPYQGGAHINLDDRMLRLVVRKAWSVSTPLPGGQIGGRVMDGRNRPVPRTVIRLGPYSAATDERGFYRFEHVPSGDYTLRLDEQTAPANSASVTAERRLRVTRKTREVADFEIAVLGTIGVAVFIDENGNGRRDSGEGVAGIALVLGDHASLTSPEGLAAFEGLRPGVHRIRLPVEKLPKDLEPLTSPVAAVTLSWDNRQGEALFLVRRKQRNVVLQDEF